MDDRYGTDDGSVVNGDGVPTGDRCHARDPEVDRVTAAFCEALHRLADDIAAAVLLMLPVLR